MKLYTVDAFTDQAFSGNPAAVCVLEKPLKEEWYSRIANEMNLSETAFVFPASDKGQYNLRWFTPTEEVDLCGHATLATAKVLYHYGYVNQDRVIEFNTRSGILTIHCKDKKISMDFPSATVQATSSDQILEACFGEDLPFVGTNGAWCLVELENETALKSLKPDFSVLKTHPQKIFIATATSANPSYDFVSRCFGPAVGINEDPVTGAAHCYLARYWQGKLNKNQLIGFQASQRTGVVSCEVLENNRVLLSGEAVIMSEQKVFWFDTII